MLEVAEVIEAIKVLIENIKKHDVYKDCRFEQIADEDSWYRLMIWFHDCVGELVINEPECAPYHFVKFEAVSYRSDAPKVIASWYDREGDTLEYIVVQIERALGYAESYSTGL